ncbi:MAG: O-antigen ligase family protein [Patescibacteria group bacterium]
MIDLHKVYKHAEQHVHLVVALLFLLLVFLIFLQSIFSPLLVLSLVIFLIFAVITFSKPLLTLTFLCVYLPFESFLLKFPPEEIYIFTRYFSEVLIYLLVAVIIWGFVTGKTKFKKTPINFAFGLFLVAMVSSAVVNLVEPHIALLGMRHILRFIAVFFVVIYLHPPKDYIKKLTFVMLAIVFVQCVLGLAQAIGGAPIDELLIPDQAHTFGDITLTAGVNQFWEAGSRVFATLGRYDRLGNFLYFFLLIGVGFLYEKSVRQKAKEFWWLFALGIPTLVLTYSRASWFAFLIGFLFIGLLIKKDRRVMNAFLVFVIVVFGYVGISGLNVRFITEMPGQTVVERFYESFSYARWRGEYHGLGRMFWLVQTPLTVIPASPVFGFGPGQYGGGVVAAIGNTRVYEKLGLPFGVYGTDGYIDNSWFSLWGEVGTLGLAFYIWMYVSLFVFAVRLHHKSKDPTTRAISIGLAAAMIGIAFNAFLSTIFEIRTIAFYLWLYAGFVVVLGTREARSRVKEPN